MPVLMVEPGMRRRSQVLCLAHAVADLLRHAPNIRRIERECMREAFGAS